MPHTVPNRPTNGAVDGDGGQEAEMAFDGVGLARDGHAHRLLDAVLDAGDGASRGAPVLEGAAPFAHARHEHRREGMIVARGELREEFVERLARPEHLLELGRAALAGSQAPAPC